MIFSSCSNDDSSNPNVNPIVGTWNPTKEVDLCSTGSEEVFLYNECQQTRELTFFENGSLNIKEYDMPVDECILTNDTNGTWTLEAGNLTIVRDGNTIPITYFVLANDVLQFGFDMTSQNIQCDSNGTLSASYTEFIRGN